MPFRLLKLSDGTLSLEFETSDVPLSEKLSKPLTEKSRLNGILYAPV